MNILQAYELAKLGMVVIAPDGVQCRHLDFDRTDMFMHSYVFGTWKEKREPRVLWGNEYNKTIDGHHVIQLYDSKEFADKSACKDRIACVKFIEVIDEA